MHIHFASQGLMNILFFYYDRDTSNCQLNFSINFITIKLVGSQIQASIYLSWLICMTHWAMSYAFFLSCLLPKQDHCNWMFIFKYSIYKHLHDCDFSVYYPSQRKRFSSKVVSWHLTHAQTNILSNRKICTTALCGSQSWFFLSCFVLFSGYLSELTKIFPF